MSSTQVLRRGLPRTPGGEPWPPASVAGPAHNEAVPESTEFTLRRGLPRMSGGEPWPPVTKIAAHQVADSTSGIHSASGAVPTHGAPAHSGATSTASSHVVLRQGLPRTPGGSPWPPVSACEINGGTQTPESAAPSTGSVESSVSSEPARPTAPTQHAESTDTAEPTDTTKPTDTAVPARPAGNTGSAETGSPEPVSATSRKHREQSKTDSVLNRECGPFSLKQWLGGGLIALGGIIALAALIVVSARWFLHTEAGAEFIANYDGHPELPAGTPVGFPAWLSWQHFLNFFFMALIVKTGLSIRYERKAPAYWAPKRKSAQKISLTIWTHLVFDLLWVINGVIFFVLLFATGQWARIIPTSLDVFPHAASAAVQYASLDWPTENGWVHYNGLQLLLYFFTVFVVAPLAIATGLRMSTLWPQSQAFSSIYPISIARKIHMPIAVYFIVFTVIHVLMVFATGALRNLNHMWAAQGDPDPAVYAGNWSGFVFFVIGLAVTFAAVVFARPMVLAPLARIFGNVTAR